jgi:hypothetical protein
MTTDQHINFSNENLNTSSCKYNWMEKLKPSLKNKIIHKKYRNLNNQQTQDDSKDLDNILKLKYRSGNTDYFFEDEGGCISGNSLKNFKLGSPIQCKNRINNLKQSKEIIGINNNGNYGSNFSPPVNSNEKNGDQSIIAQKWENILNMAKQNKESELNLNENQSIVRNVNIEEMSVMSENFEEINLIIGKKF